MCGIVAMITKNRNGFTGANMDMFDALLYMDAMRGMDSTGVMSISNIGNVKIAKEASAGADFINTAGYKNLRSEAIQKGWAIVGHNRKATKGSVNDQNAHPFWVEDKLVLVHNGTMFGDHKQHADVEVDSHAIAHVLAEEPDVEKALRQVNAAYALMWYDIPNKMLKLIRNSQRPLAFAETGDALIIASEAEMLNFICLRNNVKIVSREGQAWMFKEESLHHFQLNDDKSYDLTYKQLDCKWVPKSFQTPAVVQSEWYGDRTALHNLEDGWPVVDNDVVDVDAKPVLTPSEVKALAASIVEKSKAASVLNPVPNTPDDWQKQHTYTEFMKFKGTYEKKKVVVDVRGYLPDADDTGPGAVMMTGKTLNSDGLYVVFPLKRDVFNEITSPARKDSPCLFTVEVSTVGWRTVGKDQDVDLLLKKGGVTLVGQSGIPHYTAPLLH